MKYNYNAAEMCIVKIFVINYKYLEHKWSERLKFKIAFPTQ